MTRHSRYNDVTYQRQIMNRLASMAYRHGGIKAVKESLDRAMVHLWAAVSPTTTA